MFTEARRVWWRLAYRGLDAQSYEVKFLKSGFLSEALTQCERAMKLENPHNNVGLTWAEAKNYQTTIASASTEFSETGPISDFYRLLGRAETRKFPDHLPEPCPPADIFVSANCLISVGATHAVSPAEAAKLWRG